MKLLLATRNVHKIAEIKKEAAYCQIQILSLSDFPDIDEVIEDQKSLEANSLKKAKEIFSKSGLNSLADDSGLEVEFLNGAPGVYSARYAGKHADYLANNVKLLQELKDVPFEKRNARFRCIMTLFGNDILFQTEGVLNGKIIFEQKGRMGFGYDPLFIPDGYSITLAEMDMDKKNTISHRGIALRKMMKILRKL